MLYKVVAIFSMAAVTVAVANANVISALTTNGSATAVNAGDVRLTNDFQQAGSAFLPLAYGFDANTTFSASFQWTSSNLGDHTVFNRGGDGFAFVIQNDPAGAQALGAAGGNLAFKGDPNALPPIPPISPGLAIAFDIFGFFCGTNGNTICDQTSGPVPPQTTFDVLGGSAPTLGDLIGASFTRFAWVDYAQSTQTLSVFYSDTAVKPGTPVLTDTLDLNALLGSQAYFGFSGATGDATVTTDLTSFDLSDVSTVPEPATMLPLAWILGAALLLRGRF